MLKRGDDAQRAEKEAEKARLKEEKQAQAERAQYQASPVGRAEEAYGAGAGFFQIDMPISEVSRKVMKGSYTIAGTTEYKQGYGVGRRQLDGHADTLSAIEAVGWRLEHVGYAYVMTGQVSRDKFLSSGQEVGVMGELTGIYLFRRDDSHSAEQELPAAEPERD